MGDAAVIYEGPERLASVVESILRGANIAFSTAGGTSPYPGVIPLDIYRISVPEEQRDAARDLIADRGIEYPFHFPESPYADLWPERPRKVMDKVRKAWAENDETEARRLAERYLRRHLQDEHAWVMSARVEDAAGNPDAGIRLLEEGLSELPGSFVITMALAERTEGSIAVDYYRQLVEEHPEAPHGWIGLAYFGDPDQKRAMTIAAYSRLDPYEHWSAGSSAIQLLVEAEMEIEAISFLRSLLQWTRAGRLDKAKLVLGVLLEGQDPNEAQSWFEEARAEWPAEDVDVALQDLRAQVSEWRTSPAT
jgi:hypothetical protein